jgi:hypothetical protein
MTEEVEAHVLKKYEILQKLGKCHHPQNLNINTIFVSKTILLMSLVVYR